MSDTTSRNDMGAVILLRVLLLDLHPHYEVRSRGMLCRMI
jgi:hypothetical protein